MSVLLAAMSVLVAIYYCWPAGAAVLAWYARWQQTGGIYTNALAAGLAGGVLSEVSLVYVRDRGRWNLSHVENMGFKFVLFLFGGAVVYEFYRWQAFWFGEGATWSILLPKVLVDQFIFSVFWSTTYQTLAFRWQNLRYSGRRLWEELDGNFVVERMLPVLVTNWMFWIPGVTLVYAMPLSLQMPLNIFATAIWAVLLAAVARQKPALVQVGPGILAPSTE
jgi:hypothetical protein